MYAPAQMRHRVDAKRSSSPHAGAPARRNDDSDEWGYATVGGCICLAVLLAAIGASIALTAIAVYRSVPRSTLGALCDDGNACTWDVLGTVYDVTAGTCSHYNYQNGGDCADACYATGSATCQDGECKGTCRGHCEENNALDCPIVSTVNLIALLGYGRHVNDEVQLYRECLLSGCIYTIELYILNVSTDHNLQTDFVNSIRRIFDYQSTNTTINASSLGAQHNRFEEEMLEFRVVCMSLVHPDDRECLLPIRFQYDDSARVNCSDAGSGWCALDLYCTYMFACTNPPSYSGELEFPLLQKMEFLPK